MLVITVARKPLSSGLSVAKNVLAYGTGGINIDATRIGTTDDLTEGPRYIASAMAYMGSLQTRPWVQRAIAEGRPVKDSHPSPFGRWPANLILQHLPGCQCTGTKKVPKGGGDGIASATTKQDQSWYTRKEEKQPRLSHYVDGVETVVAWDCSQGCPVAALDQQVEGKLHGRGNKAQGERRVTAANTPVPFTAGLIRDNCPQYTYDDSNGVAASRFFKQVH